MAIDSEHRRETGRADPAESIGSPPVHTLPSTRIGVDRGLVVFL